MRRSRLLHLSVPLRRLDNRCRTLHLDFVRIDVGVGVRHQGTLDRFLSVIDDCGLFFLADCDLFLFLADCGLFFFLADCDLFFFLDGFDLIFVFLDGFDLFFLFLDGDDLLLRHLD